MFKISKNVPIPPPGTRPRTEFSVTLERMKVGESFECEKHYRRYVGAYGRRFKRKFQARVAPDDKIRIWRIK